MADTRGLIETLLTLRNAIKVYHWSTTDYARHVATCSFLGKADALIDTIVETYSARYGRPTATAEYTISFGGLTDAAAKANMRSTADWLVREMPKLLDAKRDSDLLNLRDELLNDVHQALYLFELK
jgi:hypothetical protein